MQIKVLEVSEIIYICPKIFQNSEFQLFKTHPALRVFHAEFLKVRPIFS